jgi:TM2 domain-containing membrane protein YozV
MGGSRKTCGIMLALWVVSFILLFALFIGVLGFVAIYVWAVIAGYQEAVRQNEAHGV